MVTGILAWPEFNKVLHMKTKAFDKLKLST